MITFNKEFHTYTAEIDGVETPLLNFSTFIKKYKREFDVFSAGARQAKASGGNQMEIIKGWNNNNKISKLWGEVLHLTVEGWIKYGTVPKNKYLANFLVKFSDVITSLGLKREDLTAELLEGNIQLVIGGLIDVSSEKINLDLKTGNFERKKKGNLMKPFDFIDNSPLGSATLQLNYYSLFEGQEDKDLKVLYWNGIDFEVIDIPKFTDEERELLITEIQNYERG